MKKLLFFFLSFFLFGGIAFAQEGALKTDMVWTKERLDSEITTVKATYQSQLEQYLYQDKLYRIAYDQHQELQTLVSIEDLTQKAKTLGINRDDVLISYFTLLKLKLIATEGIELTLKQTSLDKLDSALSYLDSHKANLNNLNDRDQVSQSLTTFSTDLKDIEKLADEVLVLLSVGNLQLVYDKAVVLKGDIDTYLGEQGSLDLPEIARASDNTNRSLNDAKLKFDAFWSSALNKQDSNWYLARFYDQLSTTLNPIYVNLSQSISYLNELLTI